MDIACNLEPSEIDELARLVAAEQRCCAFFAFAITVDERAWPWRCGRRPAPSRF